MKTLIFDLAFNPLVVLLEKGKTVLGMKKNEESQNSDRYLEMVDLLLKEHSLKIDDIKNISINIGPGSFTGLRVAISLAKGLGFAGDISYNTFTTFDYLGSNQNIIVPGFSNFVYVKFQDGKMVCEEVSKLDKSKKYVTFDSVLYEKIKAILNVELLIKADYVSINNKAKKDVKIHELEPLYLRKSQAEIQRESRLGVK